MTDISIKDRADTKAAAAVFSDPSIQEELIQLLMTLCRIPAPSGQEQRRAAFIQNWLQAECGLTGFLDEALNVLVPFSFPAVPLSTGKDMAASPEVSSPALLFLAHTDTVFPDQSEMPVSRSSDRISSPGVGDDTACVAVLMLYLKYKKQKLFSCKKPLLFAFNSCEEGLGNLKGSRRIMEDYGRFICEAVSFDGGVNGICNHAVGALRWQITIRTTGGHSYNDFGNTNAIEAMSDLIRRLYLLKIPENGRNTYNVGTISGGTSVNTIAQSCTCLFECRSDLRENLKQMEQDFQCTLSRLKADRPDIHLELSLVGERPCGGNVDPQKQEALTRRAQSSIQKISGRLPVIGSGSTDCNIPLSLGIPAVCFGGLLGDGVHTREEYVTIPALLQEAAIMEDYLDRTLSES